MTSQLGFGDSPKIDAPESGVGVDARAMYGQCARCRKPVMELRDNGVCAAPDADCRQYAHRCRLCDKAYSREERERMPAGAFVEYRDNGVRHIRCKDGVKCAARRGVGVDAVCPACGGQDSSATFIDGASGYCNGQACIAYRSGAS